MKKFFTILFLLTVGWVSAHSQNYVFANFGSFVQNNVRNIIRENNIAYYDYETPGTGFFVHVSTLVDQSSLNKVAIPQRWTVLDFHVIDDVAIFCGTNKDGDSALLGYFYISELIAGPNVTFHYDYDISKHLATLNRIAVSRFKDKISVMAIGNSNPNVNPNMVGADRVVYIEDFFSFAQKNIFISEGENELFWDVVTTGNYFVATGTDAGNTFNMRSLPLGTNSSSFLAHFSNGYKYHFSDDFVSGIRAVNVNNDTIALAAYAADMPTSGSSNVWMHVFTVDVPTGNMGFHQMTFSTHTTPGLWLLPPREMTYLPSDTALMVIDTNQSVYISHVMRLTPYPTVPLGYWYVPQYYFLHHQQTPGRFNSLIALSPNTCMAACGNGWMIIDLGMMLPPMSHINCIASFTTDVMRMQILNKVAFNNGIVKPFGFNMLEKNSRKETDIINSCSTIGSSPLSNAVIESIINPEK